MTDKYILDCHDSLRIVAFRQGVSATAQATMPKLNNSMYNVQCTSALASLAKGIISVVRLGKKIGDCNLKSLCAQCVSAP